MTTTGSDTAPLDDPEPGHREAAVGDPCAEPVPTLSLSRPELGETDRERLDLIAVCIQTHRIDALQVNGDPSLARVEGMPPRAVAVHEYLAARGLDLPQVTTREVSGRLMTEMRWRDTHDADAPGAGS